MIASKESFDSSNLGAFVESPLRARDRALGEVVWCCDNFKAYSLAPFDFAVLFSETKLANWNAYWGIGGTADTVWIHGDEFSSLDSLIGELSTTDLSVLRDDGGDPTPGATFGIGGTDDEIYDCDNVPGWIRLRSTTDFAEIRHTYNATFQDPDGIGGTPNNVWFCDSTMEYIYELAHSDFAVVNTVAAPNAETSALGHEGMGGGDGVVYLVQSVDAELYELNPDLSVARGPIASTTTNDPFGIGGK